MKRMIKASESPELEVHWYSPIGEDEIRVSVYKTSDQEEALRMALEDAKSFDNPIYEDAIIIVTPVGSDDALLEFFDDEIQYNATAEEKLEILKNA